MIKDSAYDWDGWLDEQIKRAERNQPMDPFEGPWRHRIARKVMIELLVASGVTWAGWYKPQGLQAKYTECMGRFMRGGFGPKRKAMAAYR